METWAACGPRRTVGDHSCFESGQIFVEFSEYYYSSSLLIQYGQPQESQTHEWTPTYHAVGPPNHGTSKTSSDHGSRPVFCLSNSPPFLWRCMCDPFRLTRQPPAHTEIHTSPGCSEAAPTYPLRTPQMGSCHPVPITGLTPRPGLCCPQGLFSYLDPKARRSAEAAGGIAGGSRALDPAAALP